MRNKALLYQWLKIFLISSIYGISFHQYLYLEELVPIFIIIFAAICLVLGFLTWIGLGLMIDSLNRLEAARLIKAALAGQKAFDGRRRAVLGNIVPVKEPIKAPFSRQECMIVSYDIFHDYFKTTRSGTTHVDPVVYSGFHMAPCEIQTRYEKVKVLGFPDLSEFKEQETTTYGKARSFIEETDFKQRLRGGFIKGVNDLSRTIPLDEKCAAAEDYKLRELIPGQSIKTREQVVKNGADVCLFGVFDSSRGGIVPAKPIFGRTMNLIPGTEDQILKDLKKGVWLVLLIGFMLTAFCIFAGALPHIPDAWVKQLPAGEDLIDFRNTTLHSQGNTRSRLRQTMAKTDPGISLPKDTISELGSDQAKMIKKSGSVLGAR